MRHKYLPDERRYGLVPTYSGGNDEFNESTCFQTAEDEHYVTFRGPLDGNQNCHIHQTVEFDGASLYDVFEFVVGYDDLYDYIDERLEYKNKNHYKFFPQKSGLPKFCRFGV